MRTRDRRRTLRGISGCGPGTQSTSRSSSRTWISSISDTYLRAKGRHATGDQRAHRARTTVHELGRLAFGQVLVEAKDDRGALTDREDQQHPSEFVSRAEIEVVVRHPWKGSLPLEIDALDASVPE